MYNGYKGHLLPAAASVGGVHTDEIKRFFKIAVSDHVFSLSTRLGPGALDFGIMFAHRMSVLNVYSIPGDFI